MMVEAEMDTKRQYAKRFYEQNKERMKLQITTRARLVRNSAANIENVRDKLIEQRNSGERKFAHLRTLAKYRINIEPTTLKYYYDGERSFNQQLHDKYYCTQASVSA